MSELFAFVLILFVAGLSWFFLGRGAATKIQAIFWVCVLLWTLVALLEASGWEVPGGDTDPRTFHLNAIERSENHDFDWLHVGSGVYESWLALWYVALGPSKFLGNSLSVAALAIAFWIVHRLGQMISPGRERSIALAFFGFLPTMVIWGSITLREAYQILSFAVGCYGLIRGRLERRVELVAIGTLALVVLGMLHNALFVFTAFCWTTTMLWPLLTPASGARRRDLVGTFLARTALVLCAGLGIPTLLVVVGDIEGAEAVRALTTGEITGYTAHYREYLEGIRARADYEARVDTSSLGALLLTAPWAFVNYMAQPFPWRVQTVLDAYASVEVLVRITLLIGSVRSFYAADSQRRRAVALLLVLYGSNAFLWSLGTTNYGTAMRHHLVAWWILCILGTPGVARRRRRVSAAVPKLAYSPLSVRGWNAGGPRDQQPVARRGGDLPLSFDRGNRFDFPT